MPDERKQLGLWLSALESILAERNMLDDNGQIATTKAECKFPEEAADALDGFIENPIELAGLLKIARDARDGRPLSPAVLCAAHLMMREVLLALKRDDARS